MGPRYHYHTIYIGVSIGEKYYVRANVQAWNENELVLIPVQWDQ